METAVILGVVSLVLGGIFIAGAAVQDSLKMTRLTQGVILGAHTLRQKLTEPIATNTGFASLNGFCISQKIFPDFPVISGDIQNPYGSRMSKAVYGGSVGRGVNCAAYTDSSFNNYIQVSVPLPTAALCQAFVSRITARFKDNTDLGYVWLVGDNNVIRKYTTYPLSPTGTECSGLIEPVQVRLFFTYLNR